MVPTRAKAHQTNSKASRSGWRIWGGIGLVVVAGIATLVFAAPRVVLSQNQRGLLEISWQGLTGKVTHATATMDGRELLLTERGHQLIPVRAGIPSGSAVTIHLTLSGPAAVAWIPFLRRNLTVHLKTPAVPELRSSSIARSLHGGLVVTFRQPVVAVSYTVDGVSHRMALARPSKTVSLPLPAAGPGQSGSVELAASARTWEQPGSARSLTWTTVPYLTAGPSTTAAISPNGSLTVDFSQPLTKANRNHWKVLPDGTTGYWTTINASTYRFTPSSVNGFGPGALVAVDLPGGQSGPISARGAYLAQATRITWVTPDGSVLRLQQLLAQEGYLPVSFTPTQSPVADTVAAENQTIYHPIAGTFHWKYPNVPKALHTLWTPGQMSVMTKGAIMQFERVNGLTVDGIAGPEVWAALIRDRVDRRVSPDGYTYISVTEDSPETMELWVNGKLTLTSDANTGIPQTPTYLGTYAIYERLSFQIMRGKNPDGVPYAVPVHWINYFAGSDAVHGFLRASYGFPQSLGCVELPIPVAQKVFGIVHYGTLVTVNPPGVAPAPAVLASSKAPASAAKIS